MGKVFQEWLDELDAYAAQLGWPENIVKQTGSDCWRDYYMDGYTPAEAWAEDMSYADIDESALP